MLDDFVDNDLAMSFGVDINADRDLEIVQREVKIQQHDHSCPVAPILHLDIAFFRKMIAVEGGTENTASIHEVLANAHITCKASVILKIDIESSEWSVLDACLGTDLDRFSRIRIELHNIDRAIAPYWMHTLNDLIITLNNKSQTDHVYTNNFPKSLRSEILVCQVRLKFRTLTERLLSLKRPMNCSRRSSIGQTTRCARIFISDRSNSDRSALTDSS